jgi:hypothetical protein
MIAVDILSEWAPGRVALKVGPSLSGPNTIKVLGKPHYALGSLDVFYTRLQDIDLDKPFFVYWDGYLYLFNEENIPLEVVNVFRFCKEYELKTDLLWAGIKAALDLDSWVYTENFLYFNEKQKMQKPEVKYYWQLGKGGVSYASV